MIKLNKLAFVAAIALLPSVAFAQAPGPNTFEFEGATWSVRNFGGASQKIIDKFRNASVTRNMMTPGFGLICKNHVVDMVKVADTKGGADLKMTAEQKFRGDGRFHVVCAWGAPAYHVAETPVAPPAAVAAAPVAPAPAVAANPLPPGQLNDHRDSNVISATWRGKGEKI